MPTGEAFSEPETAPVVLVERRQRDDRIPAAILSTTRHLDKYRAYQSDRSKSATRNLNLVAAAWLLQFALYLKVQQFSHGGPPCIHFNYSAQPCASVWSSCCRPRLPRRQRTIRRLSSFGKSSRTRRRQRRKRPTRRPAHGHAKGSIPSRHMPRRSRDRLARRRHSKPLTAPTRQPVMAAPGGKRSPVPTGLRCRVRGKPQLRRSRQVRSRPPSRLSKSSPRPHPQKS